MPFYFCGMVQLMEWFWFFCLLIITGHHLLIFRLRPLSPPKPIREWPGVSILIAHKNHVDFLMQLLPQLIKQDYPLFEIVVIDDHSEESEKSKLRNSIEAHSNINLLEAHLPGKKEAINYGIKNARHDLILCTDADCLPVSDQWIKLMVSSGRMNEVVLGYSPLQKNGSWLNMLIRFETLYTGIQFLSWARIGRPYMGVGRNLLYPRMLFLKINPFEGNSFAYGDDDMLVQKMSQHARIKTCEYPLSFVSSIAPLSLSKWLSQKHRHMSAGHEYKHGAWWTPAFFAMALIVHWLLAIPLLVFSLWWKWLPVLIIGLIVRWINYFLWTKRFGEKDTAALYPVLEIGYSAYLGLLGIFTSFIKKKKWN